MPPLVPASLSFRGGAPYSDLYGDIYASAAGGLDETRHVFIEGNALAARFGGSRRFTIIETGFGSGLNFLAAWQAFRQHAPPDARLDFVSVEKHPLRIEDLRRLLAAQPSLSALSAELLANYPPLVGGFHRLELDAGRVGLLLLLGEAREQLAALQARADAFFLDGFAPAKNPDMWSPALCAELGRLAAPGASFATYTVAARVRDALAAAGFSVDKRPGFGPKRDMLAGHYRGDWLPAQPLRRRALIVGAGIAGSHCARVLARDGYEVEVLDAGSAPAAGASGNPAGLVRPFLSLERGGRGEFTMAAYFHAVRHYAGLASAASRPWHRSGVLQLARDAAHADKLYRALDQLALPEDVARAVDAQHGSRLCGARVVAPGVWFDGAGWLSGAAACAAALHSAGGRVRLRVGVRIARAEYRDGQWQLFDARDAAVASADEVILACGHAAAALIGPAIALRAVRGQLSLLPARGAGPSAAVCQEGYVTPAIDGFHVVGASFDEGDEEAGLRDADHDANLARARRMLPEAFGAVTQGAIGGWVGLRCVSRDRRPLLGTLAPGLHACLALGSRGFTWAPLGAEIVAAGLSGAVLPVPRAVARSLAPARFAPPQPQ